MTGSPPREGSTVENHTHRTDSSAGASTHPPFEGISPVAEPLDVSQDRQWATLAHLGGVVGAVPSYVIHRVFAQRGPFTEQESREALNYTLLPSLVILACIALAPLPAVGWVFAVVAALLWLALAVQSVIAGSTVNRGEPYLYRGNTRLYDRLVSRRSVRA